MSTSVKTLSQARKDMFLVYTKNSMHIAILGRQPALGMAELEHLYDSDNVRWFSDISAQVKTSSFSIDNLGGTQKAGRVVAELPKADWRQASMKTVQAYLKAWAGVDHKITLGIS